MRQVVADASFCDAWILQDKASDQADKLLQQIAKGTAELIIPSLWHYEMSNLLRSALRRKRITQESLLEAVTALQDVPITHCDLPNHSAQQRIMHLAIQFDLSSYDAAYLELADRFKIKLYSSDSKLNAAAKHLGLIPK